MYAYINRWQLNPPSPNAGNTRRRAQPWILLAALFLRWGFVFQNGPLLLPDSWGRYLPIANDLFSHWSGTVYDAPGYPVFLALVQKIGIPSLLAPLVQGLLDTLTVWFIWRIALRLGWQRGAFYLALYFALSPASILFAGSLLSETLFTFLVMGAVWLFAELPKEPPGDHKPGKHPARFALMGFALGLACLTRPQGQLVLIVFTLVFLCTRLPSGKWLGISLFWAGALLPIVPWVAYNARHHRVAAIAQGGGWQWLQNMAYFDLVDPQTLPEEERNRYRNWESLSALRARLSADPNLKREELDPFFGDLAMRNFKEQPLAYLAAMPAALLLPRAFIKDVTRAGTKPELWREYGSQAAAHGYGQALKPLKRYAPINRYFSLSRRLTIFSGKYTLLLICLFPAVWFAWRQRNSLLFLAAALPLGQFLALLLLLNPIERYYYPFESLMTVAFIVTFTRFRSIFRRDVSHE